LRLDLILISTVGTSSNVGLYVIALSYASLQSAILASVLQLLLPKISSISDQGERLLVSARASRLAVLASASLGVLLALLSPFLLPVLFGNDFRGAVWIAVILCGTSGISFANAVISDCLRGFGFAQRPLVSEAVASSAIAALLLPSYRLYGLYGLASITVGGTLLGLICLGRFMKKDLHVDYAEIFVPKKADIEFLAARARSVWRHYRR
jgi:O-antigen/teichoic acid export membrane protein